MTSTVLVNGNAESHVSVLDRGLMYGDGLFETIRVQKTELCLWEKHVQRLLSGCERLGIPAPDPIKLKRESESLLKLRHNGNLAVIKIIITRGEGHRGYVFPKNPTPNRIVILQEFPDYAEDNWVRGVKVCWCKTRLAVQPALAGLKHLNCLQQVLARNEWQDGEIMEGFMLDNQDRVVEGCMSNIFLVKNGELITPDLSECGVSGVMRQRILELARDNDIQIHITSVSKEDILLADELFISNSLIEIWPVRQLDQKVYKPGPVTKQFMKRLQCV